MLYLVTEEKTEELIKYTYRMRKFTSDRNVMEDFAGLDPKWKH